MDMGAHRVWNVVVDSQRRDHATLFGFQHVGARFCERFFGKELVQIKVCTITRDLVRIFLTPHSSSEQTIRQQHDSVHDSGFDDYLCTTGKLYLRELPCRRLRCNLETAMTTELENVYSIRISGTHKYGLWTRCNQFLDGCKRNWERWGVCGLWWLSSSMHYVYARSTVVTTNQDVLAMHKLMTEDLESMTRSCEKQDIRRWSLKVSVAAIGSSTDWY